MDFKHSVKLTIQNDLINKLGKTTLVDALIELIWNALDADALNVKVLFNENGLGAYESVQILDDGTGIPFKEAKNIFKNLGGSQKKNRFKTEKFGRFLHGKEGKGRLKSLSIGAVVDWNIAYYDEDKAEYFTYKVRMNVSDPSNIQITEPAKELINLKTGISVSIYDIPKDKKGLTEVSLSKLLETFALYLYDYSNVNIFINEFKLDPKKVIIDVNEYPLDFIDFEGKKYPSSLKITEWDSSKQKPTTYLSDNNGIPYLTLDMGWSYPSKKYTAYIQSAAVIEMLNSHQIDLAGMNPSIKQNVLLAQNKIQSHFREIEAKKADDLVLQWKREGIYPYSENAHNVIEKVEREVFNVVASTVSHNIDKFEKTSEKNKKFQFRLLKQALETNPESLQTIIEEVLNLKPQEQDDLANLLKDISLSSIISASKIVADRIQFIEGLENIINSKEGKEKLKERTQLHRLLAENCWVFGDEYFISVDDQSLTECLKKHKKIIGEDVDILEPVAHPTKTRGIVDLMLSRTTRLNKPGSAKHLVIELKRPNVKIGRQEISQIFDYADAIRGDSRFNMAKAKWTFIVISLSKDESLASRYRDFENGILAKQDDFEILVKTWAEVFDECKSKLQFFQEKLQYKVASVESFEHLKASYPNYVEGIDSIN